MTADYIYRSMNPEKNSIEEIVEAVEYLLDSKNEKEIIEAFNNKFYYYFRKLLTKDHVSIHANVDTHFITMFIIYSIVKLDRIDIMLQSKSWSNAFNIVLRKAPHLFGKNSLKFIKEKLATGWFDHNRIATNGDLSASSSEIKKVLKIKDLENSYPIQNKENKTLKKMKNKIVIKENVEIEAGANYNSKDVEILKVLMRSFKKLTNNSQSTILLKDKLLADVKDKTDYKKALFYTNKLFGDKPKITYGEFLKALKSIDIEKGQTVLINTKEKTYNELQRIYSSEDKNRTHVVLTGTLLDKVYEKYADRVEEKVYKELASLAKGGHFSTGGVGFIRYTNISNNWIHIDAIQTDFFNAVRRTSMEHNYKGENKKFVSEILGLESGVYKAAVSHLKLKNPNVKIWTMNTDKIIKEVEMIRSDDKVSSLYTEFPPKLGFKLIKLSKLKKIVDTRKESIKKNIGINRTNERKSFLSLLDNFDKPNFDKIDELEIIQGYCEHYENNPDKFTVILDGMFAVLKRWEKEYKRSMVNIEEALMDGIIEFDKLKDSAYFGPFRTFAFQLTEGLSRRNYVGFYLEKEEEIKKTIRKNFNEYKEIVKKELKKHHDDAFEMDMPVWWANRDMLNESTFRKNVRILLENK